MKLFNTKDPFYSTRNIEALKKSIDEVKKGKLITKTIKELERREK